MDNKKILFFCTLTFSIALEVYVRYVANMFVTWPPIDNFMHFFWGMNIFLYLVLFRKWQPKDALLAVFVWQMFWEVIEMVGDLLFQQQAAYFDHMFFDGMQDTLMDVCGALLGWLLIHALGGASDTHQTPVRSWLVVYSVSMAPMLVLGSLLSFVQGKSADVFAIAWIVALVPITIWFVRR